MKKTIVTLALAASMVAPAIAFADATVYGNIHLSINDIEQNDGDSDLDMTSNTSAIGVKGSEDLGDGLKAIYKAEFQLDPAEGGFSGGRNGGLDANDNVRSTSNGNALTQRDTFVGLKGGMGTIKFGTFSSNYKQMGGKVDGLYRTRLEGRGVLHTQSNALHGGRGVTRGRQTNSVQYSSPKFSGIQLVANRTFSGADGNTTEETTGVGVRWSNKNILAYFDWIDVDDGAGLGNTEDAMKFGGKYKTKAFWVAGQYEDVEDVDNFTYIHLNAGFNINKNNAVMLTVGTAEHVTDSAQDTDSIAVAYNHKLSKLTNVYAGYGTVDDDANVRSVDVLTFGIKKKF